MKKYLLVQKQMVNGQVVEHASQPPMTEEELYGYITENYWLSDAYEDAVYNYSREIDLNPNSLSNDCSTLQNVLDACESAMFNNELSDLAEKLYDQADIMAHDMFNENFIENWNNNQLEAPFNGTSLKIEEVDSEE